MEWCKIASWISPQPRERYGNGRRRRRRRRVSKTVQNAENADKGR